MKTFSQKYVPAAEAFYDEDQQLYYAYVGVDNSKRTLALSAWGKTPEEAVQRAEWVAEALNCG
jgi:hypothetical protein